MTLIVENQLQYGLVNRAIFGKGDWLVEPDAKQWMSNAGLPCFITRTITGRLVAYVAVPADHALRGITGNQLRYLLKDALDDYVGPFIEAHRVPFPWLEELSKRKVVGKIVWAFQITTRGHYPTYGPERAIEYRRWSQVEADCERLAAQLQTYDTMERLRAETWHDDEHSVWA